MCTAWVSRIGLKLCVSALYSDTIHQICLCIRIVFKDIYASKTQTRLFKSPDFSKTRTFFIFKSPDFSKTRTFFKSPDFFQKSRLSKVQTFQKPKLFSKVQTFFKSPDFQKSRLFKKPNFFKSPDFSQ